MSKMHGFVRIAVAAAGVALLVAGAVCDSLLASRSEHTMIASSLSTDASTTSSMSGYMVAVG